MGSRDGSIDWLKRAQREEALAARRVLSPEERTYKSSLICEKLKMMSAVKEADVVFSYAAARDEADLGLLHEYLRAEGKKIAFPVTGKHIDGRGRTIPEMTACVPEDESAWTKGAFGIPEPDAGRSEVVPVSDIDVILVPCVGFAGREGSGYIYDRLGHGGGYYDRYLAGAGPETTCILVAFEAQRLDAVCTCAADIPLKVLVTESELVGLVDDF